MFTGSQIVDQLRQAGITHVVWLPDSALGEWEHDLANAPGLELVRVCREGEAWAVAMGLYLGGQRPMVMIQCTGLFESGDALRNALCDYGLPLFALIGYRSYLGETAIKGDTARTFTEPILQAWGIDYVILDTADKLPLFLEHFRACQAAGKPGVVLLGEGRV